TTLSGTTHANAVHYPNVLLSDYADATWTAQIGRTVSATASVDLGEHDLLGFPGDVGHAEVVVGAEKVDFDVALSSGERDAWRIEGDYRLADSTMTFETLALAPTPRATWNAAPGAHLRIADGGIRDAAIALEGNLGRIEVTGDLTQQGVMDGRLQLSAFQADSIAELFPDQFSGLAGLVNLDVTVKGRASAPLIDGTIDARGLWWGEAVRWLDVAGTIHGEGDRLTVGLTTGVAGAPLAEIHGYLPVHLDLAKAGLDTDGDVAIDVDLLPGDLVRVGLLAPAAEGSVPQGRASASLSVRGRMGDPDIRLAGVTELPITGWRKLGRVEFDVTRTRDQAVVQVDALDGLVPVGSISGTGTTRIGEVFAWALESAAEPDFEDYGMYLDDLDMTVGLSGLPVERLASAAGSTVRLRGSLLGGFVVTGSPWAPVVEGGVQWLDPVVGHQKLEGAFVSLLPSETGYATDLEIAFARGGGLRIAGDVGVKPDFRRPFEEWSEGDLDLEIGGAGVPLSIVGAFVPGVRGAKARVIVQGTVKGTPLHPDPLIDASITDGYIEIDALGLKLENIDLAVTAENRRVTLEASLYPEPLQRIIGIGETAESSRISAKGSMQLVGGMPDAVSGAIKLENGAWVAAMPDGMLRMEGDISATGRWPALEVGGDLAVHTGRLALDAASFAEAAPLTPDPRLSIARGDLPVAEAAVVGPSIFDEIVVDIDLALNRSLDLQWSMAFAEDFGSLGAAVSRLDLDARLGGSIDLQIERGTPTIVGEVEVVEGDLRILRSAFDLQAGSIVFTGGDPFEPNLDLSAEMSVPGATVDVAVSGTPSAPIVQFSSEDIQDEAAILTVLITGAPPEELTSNQGEAAAEAVAGLLLNSVLAGTNLGNLSIAPDGSVTVGLPVSQRIYAESLFKPGATVDENVIALRVEWTMFPRLVLSAALGDYESTSDVYWQVKF
ncbi:MAG: translocation/assembly module TamB domain-containing protein, partial [Deltaproteobacteria bacterium]|nr:translocation/assembly module TamB domain-containing protein [Deltaproteobacteria bacterium]